MNKSKEPKPSVYSEISQKLQSLVKETREELRKSDRLFSESIKSFKQSSDQIHS